MQSRTSISRPEAATARHSVLIYESRPDTQWALGGGLLACVAAWLLLNGANLLQRPVNDTWLEMVIGVQMTAVAIWLLSRSSVRIEIDPRTNELQVARRILLMRAHESQRVPLASVTDITRGDIETADGCVYQAELACHNGTRVAVSRRMTCPRRCEAVITELRQALQAQRTVPL